MRSFIERETALTMYFEEGLSYQCISKKLNISTDTVKTWCRRYRKKMGIPKRDEIGTTSVSVEPEYIHKRLPKSDTPEDRIARLEMEVELLRNFLVLSERG